MRHVHLGPVYEGVKGTGGKKQYPALDFGVGLNFELDTAELQPLVGDGWAGMLVCGSIAPATPPATARV